MPLILHAHPFSSYCQKVLTALYENETPFEMLLLADADSFAELERLWPIRRMPVLIDGSQTVIESSIIIEYLALHHPGPLRLIPQNPKLALEVRFLDRFSDQYVMTPMQKIVFDCLRPAEARDPHGVGEARARRRIEQRAAHRDIKRAIGRPRRRQPRIGAAFNGQTREIDAENGVVARQPHPAQRRQPCAARVDIVERKRAIGLALDHKTRLRRDTRGLGV